MTSSSATARAPLSLLGSASLRDASSDDATARADRPTLVDPRRLVTDDAARAAGRRRVLIVDDNLPLLRVVARSLRAHEVVMAASIVEAKRAFETSAFDAVVCDLHLGQDSGIDLKSWVERELGALAPPFLFLTGDHPGGDLGSGGTLDGAMVLGKPVSAAVLQQAIGMVTDVDSSSQSGIRLRPGISREK